MPNGTREPYRFGDIHGYDEPSPMHTSDSEETEVNKIRYHLIVTRVHRRVRRFNARRRIAKCNRYLQEMRLLPHNVPEAALANVAAFLAARRSHIPWHSLPFQPQSAAAAATSPVFSAAAESDGSISAVAEPSSASSAAAEPAPSSTESAESWDSFEQVD